MKRTLALIALAGMALTGCSAAEAPAPAAAPTSSAAPSSTAPSTSSVADYIAGTTSLRRQLQEWTADIEETTCGFGSLSLSEKEQEVLCSMRAVTMGYQASTASISLQNLGSPKSVDYIGPPPVELELRVSKAIALAESIGDETKTIEDDDCNPTLGCASHFRAAESGFQELADELNSWEAYN